MDAFDEYRFLAMSTQFLTERRQMAIRTYLTVNTLIFAVLGVLLKEAVFREWLLLVVSISLSAVGVLACWVWYRTLVHYRELIAWRYQELMKMEQEPALSAAHKTYTREWNEFYSPGSARPKVSFSDLEAMLPQLFIAFYILFAVCIVLVITIDLR